MHTGTNRSCGQTCGLSRAPLRPTTGIDSFAQATGGGPNALRLVECGHPIPIARAHPSYLCLLISISSSLESSLIDRFIFSLPKDDEGSGGGGGGGGAGTLKLGGGKCKRCEV